MASYTKMELIEGPVKEAVDKLFDRLLTRFVGPELADKQIRVRVVKGNTLQGIFEAACKEEGGTPNRKAIESLADIASNYIEAYRDICTARVLKEVNAFLTEKPSADVATVLGGKLSDVWGDISNSVRKVVEAETNTAKNVGFMDAITQISDTDDPVVYFSGPLDAHTCSECKRLFLMGDGHTPRLWYMSELGHGYAKKGDAAPSCGGQHPNCFIDKKTPVLTETGWKRISEIKVGESVLTHKGRFKKVIDKIDVPYSEKRTIKVKYKYQDNILTLTVTPDHRFLTQRGWVEAQSLQQTDSLIRLNVPCPVCSQKVTLEGGRYSGAFKLNQTCGSAECSSALKSDRIKGYHDNLSLEDRAIRAANCSEGTRRYNEEHGCVPMFARPSYWTEERREKTRANLIARLPEMMTKSASTRISREQMLAFGWLKAAFPEEEIELEYPVETLSIDIAFPKHKVAVEIDGKYHVDRAEEDAARDSRLKAMGWTTLRFGRGEGKPSVKKSNIISGVSVILSNHNGLYSFEESQILSVEERHSGWKSRAHCLTVEDDESFIAKGIVTHNCRHSLCHMPPGYGFDAAGNIEFKSVGYSAIRVQRGL